MASRRYFVFLTLVLSCQQLWGKTHETADAPSAPAQSPSPPVLGIEGENLVITTPPPVPEDVNKKFFYPYTQSLAIRTGLFFDPQDEEDRENQTVVGISYLLPRKRSPQIDLGVDGTTVGVGFINGLIRWTPFEREILRPFYKAGLSVRVLSNQRLAGIGATDNWLIRGGFGFEYYYRDPVSLKLELEGAGSTDGFVGLVALGASWGW